MSLSLVSVDMGVEVVLPAGGPRMEDMADEDEEESESESESSSELSSSLQSIHRCGGAMSASPGMIYAHITKQT